MSAGTESGPPGHGTWSHQGDFSHHINENLQHWTVMSSLLCCVAVPRLRTRVHINVCQGAVALGAPQPGLALLCIQDQTDAPSKCYTSPAGKKNHPRRSHKTQEGRDGPSTSSELGYKGNGSAEPVLFLTALFIPRYSKERGPFPQMSAKHRAC